MMCSRLIYGPIRFFQQFLPEMGHIRSRGHAGGNLYRYVFSIGSEYRGMVKALTNIHG